MLRMVADAATSGNCFVDGMATEFAMPLCHPVAMEKSDTEHNTLRDWRNRAGITLERAAELIAKYDGYETRKDYISKLERKPIEHFKLRQPYWLVRIAAIYEDCEPEDLLHPPPAEVRVKTNETFMAETGPEKETEGAPSMDYSLTYDTALECLLHLPTEAAKDVMRKARVEIEKRDARQKGRLASPRKGA